MRLSAFESATAAEGMRFRSHKEASRTNDMIAMWLQAENSIHDFTVDLRGESCDVAVLTHSA